MPDRISSGGCSFRICRQAIITQSVGVPLTAKRRSAIWRRRSGEVRVSECDAPDCSFSGATTQTSSLKAPGDFFGDGKARRMDAVVIGDQDAHAQPIFVLPLI